MHPHCVFIDAVTLRRLYIDGMMTTVQVARHFNCSPSTVRRQLLRFGIPARRRGPAPGRVHVARGAPFAGCSADVAYVVGLIATDGNLGRKRAAISIVSKDVDLSKRFDAVLSCPPRSNRTAVVTAIAVIISHGVIAQSMTGSAASD